MEDKFDFHNCGNDDALSFGKAMLKIETLKKTVNKVLPENGLGQTLNSSLSKQNLDIDVGLTTDQTRYLTSVRVKKKAEALSQQDLKPICITD